MIVCSECGTQLAELRDNKVMPCGICMAHAHFDGYAEGLKKAVEMITKINGEARKEGGE